MSDPLYRCSSPDHGRHGFPAHCKMVPVEPDYEAAHTVIYEGKHFDGCQTLTRETVVAAVDAALKGTDYA